MLGGAIPCVAITENVNIMKAKECKFNEHIIQ